LQANRSADQQSCRPKIFYLYSPKIGTARYATHLDGFTIRAHPTQQSTAPHAEQRQASSSIDSHAQDKLSSWLTPPIHATLQESKGPIMQGVYGILTWICIIGTIRLRICGVAERPDESRSLLFPNRSVTFALCRWVPTFCWREDKKSDSMKIRQRALPRKRISPALLT
jgi:hypothetical protein